MDNPFKDGYYYLIASRPGGNRIIQIINRNYNDPFMLVLVLDTNETGPYNWRVLDDLIIEELGCNKKVVDLLYKNNKLYSENPCAEILMSTEDGPIVAKE